MAYSFLEPIRVGRMVLKNRIIVPAMARYLCEDGFATEDYIRYYEAMAKGGVAMVTVGIMPIDLGWPSTMPSQPCLGDDKYIPQLQKAVTAMHAAGAKVSFQPWMPGRAPYTYADAVERAQDIAIVNKLTKDEILNIERKYVAACLRCAACGVDAIEWHNAHNYLGEQFFSPYFNHRTDEYGQQNVENSMRFARECISKARRALDEAGYPNVEIIAKLNGSDILPGGVTPEILAASAKELEKVGVAMITVNAGGGLTRLEGMSGDGHRAEGWKVPLAEIVKAAVSIPVAASGNLKRPSYVDSIIKEGRCDLVALGRTTIADPYWVSKCAAGREDLIRYCLSCMHCIYAQPRKECGCTMNPRCRRESFVPEIESLPKVGNGRKVMVIGAGPAGCAAAIALAQRGFKPIICEKSDYIGGMMLVAGMPIGKQEFQYGIGYYMNMLRELKVEVRLNTEATPELIRAEEPYAVICAVGTNELVPPIKGIDGPNVITVRSYLVDRPEYRNRRIAVIGGGQTGLEAAHMLRSAGNDVVCIEMQPRSYATLLEHKLDLEYAEESGVNMLFEHKVLEFGVSSVVTENLKTGESETVEADVIVLAFGVRPNSAEVEKLRECGVEKFFNVGDSNKPGMIYQAVAAAHDCAIALE